MKTLSVLIIIMVILFGCNSETLTKDESIETIQPEETSIVNIEPKSDASIFPTAYVSYEIDLPDCDLSTKGYMFFIADLNTFKACVDESYISINIKGDSGEKGDSGDSIVGEQGEPGIDSNSISRTWSCGGLLLNSSPYSEHIKTMVYQLGNNSFFIQSLFKGILSINGSTIYQTESIAGMVDIENINNEEYKLYSIYGGLIITVAGGETLKIKLFITEMPEYTGIERTCTLL